MEISKKVYCLLKQIPKGKVTTYKILSKKVKVNNPRLIGYILHNNLKPESYPCHRVVRSDGTLAKGYAYGGKSAQKRKLMREGVAFCKNGKVNFPIALFDF